MAQPLGDAPQLSVVIPLYNEAPNLAVVFDRIQTVLNQLDTSWELVLVDDGSSDDSWAEIQRLAAQHDGIRACRLSRNFGKEAALAAGLNEARGQGVIVMDGDLQHPPELIPDMVAHWRAGAEVVEAVKTDRGREPLWMGPAARLFYRFMRVPGADLRGATDFKLMDRRVVDAWRDMGERNVFFRGMAAWLGFQRQTVHFSVPARVGGATRWRPWQLLRLGLTGITSFTSLPLHLTTLIGGVFFLFSLILGGHTLYMKFSGQAVSGFATVILLLLITGSCILISLGIMGIYLARIYEEVKGRPRYLIRDRIAPKDGG